MTDAFDIPKSDSPCQLICAIDKESGLCMGCGRSMDEISSWTLKTKLQRAAIIAELPGRMPPLREKLEAKRARRRVKRPRT